MLLASLTAFRSGRCQEVPAGSAILHVASYNVEQGLNQSTVYRVLQDDGGLLWVTTGAGLQYFDGTVFRSFYPPDEPSIAGYGNAMQE